MTNYGPSTAFLLVGGKDISSDTFTLKDGVEEMTEDVGGLGRTFDGKKGIGVGMVTLEAQGGLYDDRAAGNIEALQGKSGARQLVSYGYAGTDPGADVVMLDGALITKFNRVIARDALTKAEPEYLISADYMRGVVLHGLTEETADGDTEADSVDHADSILARQAIATSSVSVGSPPVSTITTVLAHGLVTGDTVVIGGHTSTPSINGEYTVTVTGTLTFEIEATVTGSPGTGGYLVRVNTAAGGVADLHVPALDLDGYTDLVVQALGSTDDITFAPLVTFTAVTVAGTAERKEIATEIPRYTAAGYALTGAGTAPSFVPYVALHRS